MISLYDILEASNGQLFGEPAAQLFTDFCLDADKAGPNLLFLALRTDHGDSHAYIPEAIQNGVSGVICMRPPDYNTEGVSVVLVRDTVEALMAWTHYVLGKLGAKVIGVTGTAGKSVTVEAVGRVLETRYPVHYHVADGSGRLNIPLSLAKISNRARFVVLKLATTQPGEMATMVQAVQPEVGIVTQVSTLHTDRFDAPEQVASEQGVLVDYLSPTGLAVLNYDNDLVRAMGNRTRAGVKTIGLDSFGADMMAYNLVIGPEGTGFDLRHGNERFVGRWTPLLGKHHLLSVMAALSVAQHYDVPLEDALRALTALRPLPGRMNPLVGHNDVLLVDDSNSANPQSTLAALDWLEAVRAENGRTFFIMGDMENLGERSRLGHRLIGQRAAEVAHVLITQGKEAALVARAALDQGMEPEHVHTTYNTQDVVAILERHYDLTSNDTVLVKGGPNARMELVTQALLKSADDQTQLPRQQQAWKLASLLQPTRTNWVEVDTAALANNVRALKAHLGREVALMAVVKSDAYGHGAVVVSQTALLNGATYLGVSSLAEALELRDAGIEAPILAMNYTPVYLARQAIQQNVTVTLYDLEMARAYDRAAREVGAKLKVHLKIDTGMGRLGVMPNEAIPMFRYLTALHNLDIEGIYTHFSAADSDPGYTAQQLSAFRAIVRPLQATIGFRFRYIHAANSTAALLYRESHFNMVRAGLAMYGLHPSESIRLPDSFSPVLTWKTVVAQVKTLPPGHPVGYGNTYITQGYERMAVLPVGYGDGLRRAPHDWGEVLIRGKRAPIVGRVSMEKIVVRVDAVNDVSIGDEVVLLGRQGEGVISAEEVAARLGTNNYEVVCSVLPRIPRW
ncbi:MAG: alanine racemase [bacterium]|nr:alanine racemase [bacterium]